MAEPSPTENETYASLWADRSTLLLTTDILSYLYHITARFEHHDKFKFYMKGGNAIACLKHSHGIDAVPQFPSDFDYTILISPELIKEEYDEIQAYLIGNYMNAIYRKLMDMKVPVTIVIEEVHGKYAEYAKQNPRLSKLVEQIQTWTSSSESEYTLVLRTNTMFGVLLHVGGIFLKYKGIELFDISFTLYDVWFDGKRMRSHSISNIKRDWEITEPVVYDNRDIHLIAYIYDPFTAYVNMRIAASRNIRKKEKRTRRANTIRNKILLKNYNNNTRRKRIETIKHTLRANTNEIQSIFKNNSLFASPPLPTISVAENKGGNLKKALLERMAKLGK